MLLMYADYVDAGLITILLLLATALTLTIFSSIGLLALYKRRFKRAATLLLGPIVFIPMYLSQLGWTLAIPFELVRFYYHRAEYAAVIDKLSPPERASKVVFFYWGVTGFLSVTTDFWLVYDESGQIELPDTERSQAWKNRVYPERPYLVDEHCVMSTYRLSGYYYSMKLSCSY